MAKRKKKSARKVTRHRDAERWRPKHRAVKRRRAIPRSQEHELEQQEQQATERSSRFRTPPRIIATTPMQAELWRLTALMEHYRGERQRLVRLSEEWRIASENQSGMLNNEEMAVYRRCADVLVEALAVFQK